MTVYSFAGISWTETEGNGDDLTIDNIEYAQLDVGFLGQGSALTSTLIGLDEDADEPVPILDFEGDSYLVVLDGLGVENAFNLEYAFYDLSWSDGSGIVLNIFESGFFSDTSYVFSVSGDPFPSFGAGDGDSLKNFIDRGITANAPDQGTGFAPGETFNLANLETVMISEDDNYIDFENNFADVSGGLGNDTLDGADGNDILRGDAGDDMLIGSAGNDTLDGGAGTDTAVFYSTFAEAQISFNGDTVIVRNNEANDPQDYTDRLTGIERLEFSDRTVALSDLIDPVDLTGTDGDDALSGTGGNDRLAGLSGNDTIDGGDGSDNLTGGDGDDLLTGGTSENDLRDNIFGGDGNDTIRGGYGNDELRGDAGDDLVEGGFGADTVLGGTGNDSITGSALGDLLFGGDGDDFINGGFGYDRVNGGAGADQFFHIGVFNHGSDWIQDYAGADGDTLVFGRAGATAEQFQINIATTPGAGEEGIDEAFVIYRPTGQIMWALVDGAGQAEINISLGGETFDLTA